ncbi:hypothetical protein MRS44_001741 [Fusarium solani]|uniref:uncharacterized protein n=1 Tax=Fusarium solani TaxID=169388 RepID=UPI0032C479FB|nr:hypothetical protein MRS44_001741 [Fusarium solani]
MSDLVFRHRPADLLGDPFMGSDLDPVMPASGDTAKVEDAAEGEDPPVLYPETSDDQPVVTNPLAREPIRPEASCVRTTFHVNVDWRLGGSLATASNIVGQMYVERLTPPETIHPFPIVLIHGDYHTGQWKIQLPHELALRFAPASLYVGSDYRKIKYPSAKFHNKWPGSGLRHDDPYFANYCAGLTTLCLRKVERQCLGQNALQELLKHTGKAFLMGEGTGGMMAWLATDVEPDLVAGVIAIEPVGPPFGTTTRTAASGHRIFTQNVRRVEGVRIYGLTDIPLTFDPPASFHGGVSCPDQELPLDIEERLRPDLKGICYLQRNLHEDEVIFNHESGKHEMSNRTRYRELSNLKKVPQAVVTAHASSHVMYDWMTVSFMVQAGVPVQWIKLDEHQIFGNGHLMFLETNSDDIARLLTEWIYNMTPETFRGSLPRPVAPPSSRQVYGPPEEPAEQATAHLQSVDLMDGVEPAHHNDQSLGAQLEHVEPAQPEHVESSQHGVQLPGVEAGHVESVQLEHAETRVDSAESEDAKAPHHNDQSVGLQANHADLVQFEHAELPHNDQSPGSEDDVDLVPVEYPETPHNSAQNSSDQSYEPSSSSGPSGDSSGSRHSNQSSDSHHDNQPTGSRQDNHSPGSHQDNRSPGSQGNCGNPGQSEPTSDISYVNSSPLRGPSSSSAHEQSTNKRPAPSSSGRRSLASDPGSSPPATSWGPAQKRPRMSTPPLGSNYTPSATNATPGGSWYTDDSPQWDRDQSVESPNTSLAMLRPAHPAGPVQLRPRVVTTLSSPVIVSPPPVGYTPHKEFVRAYGLVDLSPAQEQLHSAARDARGCSPRDQSTTGRSDQADSPQGYTTQGHSAQGYRTQDQSTQGHHPQSYSTEGHATHGHSSQGYSTQANSTQGRSAHDHTAQGPSTHGYTTQIYPHSAARFECQPGTAEESIAAMARVNKARLASNASRSAAAAEDVHFSPFKQPRILPGSQISQLNGTNNTEEAPQATTPAPAAQPIPERPSTPEAPDSEAEDNWFSMFGCPPRATPPSPSPAPRGSSNPGSSNVSRGSPVRAGSRKRHTSK